MVAFVPVVLSFPAWADVGLVSNQAMALSMDVEDLWQAAADEHWQGSSSIVASIQGIGADLLTLPPAP
jgi:hypothetical protein